MVLISPSGGRGLYDTSCSVSFGDQNIITSDHFPPWRNCQEGWNDSELDTTQIFICFISSSLHLLSLRFQQRLYSTSVEERELCLSQASPTVPYRKQHHPNQLLMLLLLLHLLSLSSRLLSHFCIIAHHALFAGTQVYHTAWDGTASYQSIVTYRFIYRNGLANIKQ